MSLDEFRDAPWGKSHTAYSKGSLAMAHSPEYASSEVVLASVYRQIGFPNLSESSVPSQATKLLGMIRKERERTSQSTVGTLAADTFDLLLNSVLESPKKSNQSAKRFLQVTPLVPQLAVFSGSPRLSGNSWTPGLLVRRIIWLGAQDHQAAERTWEKLFTALSVNEDDDIFARFVQAEVEAWTSSEKWTFCPAPAEGMPFRPNVGSATFPAAQFVRDLNSVIEAKSMLTRRQWTSLLEAILRLGTVAHVMWVCEVHSRIWRCLQEALSGNGPTTASETRQQVFPERFSFLPLSSKPLPAIKDRISRYLNARIGINASLWALEKANVTPADIFGSAEGVLEVCKQIRSNCAEAEATKVRDLVDELADRETRTLLCRKGIGSNINEFVTYSLQQRQTANPRLRGYDQGYLLRKRGAYANSPWMVSLGPVAAIALVHCSLSRVAGPRSVHRLAQHLSQYGVTMDHREIPQNELGQQLRMLGLVLDSPDAESGMLLVPPFRRGPTERFEA